MATLINLKGSNIVAIRNLLKSYSTITYCFYGAVERNRTPDLLITNTTFHKYPLINVYKCIHI